MTLPAYSTEVLPTPPAFGGGFPSVAPMTPQVNPGNPLGMPPKSASDIPFTLGGADRFNQGQDILKPSQGLSPEIQQTLDIIRQNQDYAAQQGMSAAQALAVRRGIGGSSVEQFGVQSANDAASRAAGDQVSKVLLQQVQNAHDNQLKQADAYFARAQQEGTLTSDEIASQRNILLYQQQLELQKMLGTQANDIARENIGVSKDIANSEQRNNLINTGIGAVAPFVLPKLFGAAGAAAPLAAGGGFTPYAAGGIPGPFAPGVGAPAAGASALLPVAGAGAGLALYEEGRKALVNEGFGKDTSKALSVIPGVGLSVALANKATGGAIQKIFGGGSHTDTKGSDAWAQGMDPNEYAQKLGTSAAYSPSYDSNKAGSFENNLNAAVQALTPAQLVARYSGGNAGTRTAADKKYKALYDQGQKLAGRPINAEEMAYMLSTVA